MRRQRRGFLVLGLSAVAAAAGRAHLARILGRNRAGALARDHRQHRFQSRFGAMEYVTRGNGPPYLVSATYASQPLKGRDHDSSPENRNSRTRRQRF